MPGKERLPGDQTLLRVGVNLHNDAGEDEVSTPGVLLVIVVLLAVVALRHGHGQRGFLVVRQVNGRELQWHEVHV